MARFKNTWKTGDIALITFNQVDRVLDIDIFESPELCKIMVGVIDMAVAMQRIQLFAYCIMPNLSHVHIVVKFLIDPSLAMKSVKGNAANLINTHLGRRGQLFQHKSHDQIIRTREHFLRACFYVWNNPMAADLTKTPSEYAFSDFNQRAPDIESVANALFGYPHFV